MSTTPRASRGVVVYREPRPRPSLAEENQEKANQMFKNTTNNFIFYREVLKTRSACPRPIPVFAGGEIYTVFDEESDFEVKNCKFRRPGAKN